MRGGKAKTEYSTDDGATWITGTSCTVLAPTDHSNDGPQAILYRSTDLAGNKEDDESVTVNIDTATPSIAAKAASGRQSVPSNRPAARRARAFIRCLTCSAARWV